MFSRLKRVLVVDDSPNYIFLYTTMLRRLDLEVLEARDGFEAAALLERNKVDLILTDFNMPGRSGVELLDWCREKDLACPVIVATCEVRGFSHKEIALGAAPAKVIRKPFDRISIEAALVEADLYCQA